jgi:hypothetical protein
VHLYLGLLEFCRTNEMGLCPSARVDASGHYRIGLRAGHYNLVPAPGRGNVVSVKLRRIVVVAGRTQTLNINRGNLQAATAP